MDVDVCVCVAIAMSRTRFDRLSLDPLFLLTWTLSNSRRGRRRARLQFTLYTSSLQARDVFCVLPALCVFYCICLPSMRFIPSLSLSPGPFALHSRPLNSLLLSFVFMSHRPSEPAQKSTWLLVHTHTREETWSIEKSLVNRPLYRHKVYSLPPRVSMASVTFSRWPWAICSGITRCTLDTAWKERREEERERRHPHSSLCRRNEISCLNQTSTSSQMALFTHKQWHR